MLTILCSDVVHAALFETALHLILKLHCPKPLYLYYLKTSSYAGNHLSVCLYTESDLILLNSMRLHRYPCGEINTLLIKVVKCTKLSIWHLLKGLNKC